MKKLISFILAICLSSSLASCGNKSSTIPITNTDEKIQFSASEELPEVSLSAEDFNSFDKFIDYDNITCPYSELFGIDAALKKKSALTLPPSAHSYDFLKGSKTVDANLLYETVKANNDKYLQNEGKFFSEELSSSDLKSCCEIVADTLNYLISKNPDIDFNNLSCILGNLKIVETNSMNYASFGDTHNTLTLTPVFINLKSKQSDMENFFEITVSHETAHLLQCRCLDVLRSEDDHFYGISYSFDELPVNPLKLSWLYEASAEINAVEMYNHEPTTYIYKIENLHSISLATILSDNTSAGHLEKLCFSFDEKALYDILGFKDKIKSMELLYAIELLRCKPEDFKEIYENKYGPLDDYQEFLKLTYNPYLFETLSKLFYRNLAYKLTQQEMSLNDVFYLISLHELDFMNSIPLNNTSVREKYPELYNNYLALQAEFFNLLQPKYEGNITESFQTFAMNYKDNGTYANATLDWLDGDKKDYLLKRNMTLFDQNFKPIITY